MRRLCVAAGLLGALVGPSFADPAITTASSNMRKTANPHARIVQPVPANAEIDIQSCRRGWCYGSWRGVHGFLPSFAVAQNGPRPGAPAGPLIAFTPPPPPLVVTAPVVVEPPVHKWGGPYVGGGFGVGWNRW